MNRYLRNSTPIHLLFLLLIMISMLLVSCNPSNTQTATQTAEDTAISPATEAPATATEVPTAPTVFLFHSSSDEGIYDSVLGALKQKTDALGWQLEPLEGSIPDMLPASVRWMVLLGPISESAAQDAAALMDNAPQTQFLSIGISDLEARPNLSRLAPDGFRLDQLGFVAGHLASVITEEWRIGLIIQSDPRDTEILQQAYANGRTFYCGICRLSYPPFIDYPIFTSLPPGAGAEEWDSAMQVMVGNGVQTVFLYADAIPDSFLERTEREGITLLGSSQRPGGAAANWAAGLYFDPGTFIEERWNPIETEDVGWSEAVPLTIVDINSALLSPGRLRWVEDLRDRVMEGIIDPVFTPAAVPSE